MLHCTKQTNHTNNQIEKLSDFTIKYNIRTEQQNKQNKQINHMYQIKRT